MSMGCAEVYAADVCECYGDYSECAGVVYDSGWTGAAGDYDYAGVDRVMGESGGACCSSGLADESAVGSSDGVGESVDVCSGDVKWSE